MTILVYYFSFQIKLNVKTKLFRYIVFLPDVTTITLVFGTRTNIDTPIEPLVNRLEQN